MWHEVHEERHQNATKAPLGSGGEQGRQDNRENMKPQEGKHETLIVTHVRRLRQHGGRRTDDGPTLHVGPKRIVWLHGYW